MYRPFTYYPHTERITTVREELESVDLSSENPLLPVVSNQFGSNFVEELTERMVGTTINTHDTARDKLSNCVGYLLARTCMANPRDDLVANLGPDEAWHTFILYMDEYDALCRRLAGDMLHHDPAGESALVNNGVATAKTIATFEEYGIPFTPELWQDHIAYPRGAIEVKSGFLPRQLPCESNG